MEKLDIYSSIFDSLIITFNEVLTGVTKELTPSDEGEITLKLNITKPARYENGQKTGEHKFSFDWKVERVIKAKKQKHSGSFYDDLILLENVNGDLLVKRVEQMRIEGTED